MTSLIRMKLHLKLVKWGGYSFEVWDDVADPDEVTPKEQKSPVTLPDVYCDDNVYPSFSVVNGHLIISAEYVRYQGRMHWAYDLQSRRIIAFPLQQNTGN